jgi:hypothetical protein
MSHGVNKTLSTFDSRSGRYTFQTIEIDLNPPGFYTFEIKGTVGAKTAISTFVMELVNPCFTYEPILLPFPFVDSRYILRDEMQFQEWSIEQLVQPST